MSDTSPSTSNANHLSQGLVARLRQLPSAVVALSGGVDSAVVAALAVEALGRRVLAVTGVSASLPGPELDDIRALCTQLGLAHRTLETHELDNPDYVKNSPERCYFCKTELFGRIRSLAEAGGFAAILDGTHADDQHVHRPGRRAGIELGVLSPLAEAGLGKGQIRELARHYGLRNAERPASPCLSSRVAYGVQVTPERLSQVGRAEQLLAALGFAEVRVRLHDRLARIEVPPRDLPRLVGAAAVVTEGLRALGFVYVTLDLQGLRAGSHIEVLRPAPENERPS